MEIWQAIVLGIVQGLTEFLPISSSGHLIIFPWLFGWDTPGLSFDAALHLGTLVAVVVFFRVEIARMIAAIPRALSNPVGILTDRVAEPNDRDPDARLGLLIAIATIPGLVLGLLFEDAIDEFFHTDSTSTRAIGVIATMMIVVAIIMWLAEKVGTRRRSVGQLTWTDAAVIGSAQAVALIPGTSRSGATISAGLFRGMKRADAARFSFLAGMPLILGAGLKSLYEVISEGMTGHEVALFLAGGISAAIVGFITIWGLLRYLETRSTLVFVVYRIVFGLFLFVMLAVK
ncbi:MAG TPA: undecaprenyl-diphosphatase UppP [Thermomicrobiales bacterium]|nr:undecaprenyl-diphosphatase UppP [Thermomicrobiales bacterium]